MIHLLQWKGPHIIKYPTCNSTPQELPQARASSPPEVHMQMMQLSPCVQNLPLIFASSPSSPAQHLHELTIFFLDPWPTILTHFKPIGLQNGQPVNSPPSGGPPPRPLLTLFRTVSLSCPSYHEDNPPDSYSRTPFVYHRLRVWRIQVAA